MKGVSTAAASTGLYINISLIFFTLGGSPHGGVGLSSPHKLGFLGGRAAEILGEDRVGWDDVREHGGAHGSDGGRGQDDGHVPDGAHGLRGGWDVSSYEAIRLH